jgi:SecD/SecF fusion protein
VLLGASAATWKKSSIFGMDFTGGFSLTLELNKLPADNYRDIVEKALYSKGLSSHDFQVRELSPSNHVRIFLTKQLEESGRPFYNLPIATDYDTDYGYQNNPRITWIVSALNEKGLTLTDSCKVQLDKDWTSISGQISSTMRNNALYGLAIALVCILLYITIRFEFKYAVAATLGLAHDVLITIGAICILHALGFPIQIELNTIAALMAIIGYSLNDTIIVFDRIREDVKTSRRSSFKEICNLALNVTLSRTLMTSGTTVLVLLALVCLGGSTIFGFAFVMTIGILFGTLSSLFIAAPLLNYLNEKESAHKDRTIEIQ